MPSPMIQNDLMARPRLNYPAVEALDQTHPTWLQSEKGYGPARVGRR